MTLLREYVEEVSGNKFQYGEWDCIQFVLQWLRFLEGDMQTPLSKVIFQFLRETNYWDTVKDAASYKTYLDSIKVATQRDLFHAFNRRGFIKPKKPRPGDLIIAPTQALGILDNGHKALFLRRTEGIVTVPVPKGSLYLSCHL